MAYMREVEKSEISHTNAIIQTDQEDLHCSRGQDRRLGATLWLNWQAAIGHFTRFPLTEPGSWLVGKGKTGIGALEDVGSIAWHRCTTTILAMTEVRSVTETCSMNVTALSQSDRQLKILHHCRNCYCSFKLYEMSYTECQCKPSP